MKYRSKYLSPIGKILLTADNAGLTGLWFETGKPFGPKTSPEYVAAEIPLFIEVKRWLDLYFSGQEPNFMPQMHVEGSPFQKIVWEMLQRIPYGTTVTYGALAEEAAGRLGRKKISARAIGGAVGRNKIAILIPCHRVVGSRGCLTGYSGGLDKKIYLLTLEGADIKSNGSDNFIS